MTIEEIPVGTILGINSFPEWRGRVTKKDRRNSYGDLDEFGDMVFHYTCIRTIRGTDVVDDGEAYSSNLKDFVVISVPEPIEEMKPTNLPSTRQYMELLGA